MENITEEEFLKSIDDVDVIDLYFMLLEMPITHPHRSVVREILEDNSIFEGGD